METAGVVIVTGGGRGIGAATARLAAERGYAVSVNYRSDAAAAASVVADARKAGAKALAVQGDVAKEADVVRLFDAATAELGPVTALVNNAGILERQCRLDEMEAARFERIFATNVIGAFLCAREAVRRMSTRHGGRGGSIVNVSSMASRLGSPGEYVDYAASKGAVETLGVGLAKELASDGVRVNVVRPGIIETDIHAAGGDPDRAARLTPSIPLRRPGTADEVAAAILWLLGDASSYTTGSVVEVTGGR